MRGNDSAIVDTRDRVRDPGHAIFDHRVGDRVVTRRAVDRTVHDRDIVSCRTAVHVRDVLGDQSRVCA